MTGGNPDPLSDDELIRLLAQVLEEDEPLPAGAAEVAAGALVWRDVEGDLAALLHDSASEEAVVLRDELTARLLVFQSGEVTLDVEQRPEALTGAVSPPARYRVELQAARPAAPPSPPVAVLTDASGMFELPNPVRGATRFVVREPTGRVAMRSPWVTL